jgi:hypothetical protein
MKKKTYVYRLVCSGVDYANLETAVQDAYANIRANTYDTDRLSSPYVLKVSGGYQVSVFRNDGSVLRRKIDVFAPIATTTNKSKVKAHNVRANKSGEFPNFSADFPYDDEPDDECDFNCDECANEECEDRLLDEDEGE